MFAIFESINGRKQSAFCHRSFATIEAALDWFRRDHDIIDMEIAADGSACDLAVTVGKILNVYAIERV